MPQRDGRDGGDVGPLRAERGGSRPVSEVNSADVLAVLTPIWHAQAPTAKALRQRIAAVMEWSVAMEHRANNPCDRIGPVLGPQRNLVQHRRALAHGDVAAAIASVRASKAARAVKLAFEFLVLTAARSGEVRGARWDEMDTKAPVWTVPPTRMKMTASTASRFAGVPWTSSTRRGRSATVTRWYFQDWAAEETDHPREVVEAALAYVVRNPVEAAYARSDLFARRRVTPGSRYSTGLDFAPEAVLHGLRQAGVRSLLTERDF